MKSVYTMVGMRFKGTELLVSGLRVGALLTLVREPTNKHDPNAVAIHIRINGSDKHIAYVKATEALILSRDMDRNGKESLPGKFVIFDRWPAVEVEDEQPGPAGKAGQVGWMGGGGYP